MDWGLHAICQRYCHILTSKFQSYLSHFVGLREALGRTPGTSAPSTPRSDLAEGPTPIRMQRSLAGYRSPSRGGLRLASEEDGSSYSSAAGITCRSSIRVLSHLISADMSEKSTFRSQSYHAQNFRILTVGLSRKAPIIQYSVACRVAFGLSLYWAVVHLFSSLWGCAYILDWASHEHQCRE